MSIDRELKLAMRHKIGNLRQASEAAAGSEEILARKHSKQSFVGLQDCHLNLSSCFGTF
jgi:hypothetical protein